MFRIGLRHHDGKVTHRSSTRSLSRAKEMFLAILDEHGPTHIAADGVLTRHQSPLITYNFACPNSSIEICRMSVTMLQVTPIQERLLSNLPLRELRQMVGGRTVKLSHRTHDCAIELGGGDVNAGVRLALTSMSLSSLGRIKPAPLHSLRPVQINLTLEEVDRAFYFGDGNVSAGVRQALYGALSGYDDS